MNNDLTDHLKDYAMKNLILLLFFIFPSLLSANELPELPEHLKNPFKNADSQKVMGSANQLEQFFDEKEYTLQLIQTQNKLPQLFTTNLPSDLNKLEVHKKTSLFIKLLLPSVIKVNNDILTVRIELFQLTKKLDGGESLSQEETTWLKNLADAYHGSPTDLKDLQERIDILPVGLVMAQAIDESGWGTSHFAIAGNALYGQHLSKSSKGTYIATPGGHVRVASFDNLYHSTASYIHNLNTTKAYQQLRDHRTTSRLKHGELKGEHLADALLHYSERGQHYVDTLKWLIKHYKLDELNEITFDEASPFTVVTLE